MKNKKNIIWFIIVIAIGVAAYFRFTKKKENSISWRTTKVEKGDVNVIITATGNISADTTVDVGTQVTGVLTKLFVDFNSIVKKGQLIALIDTTTLYAIAQESQANVTKTKAQLDQYKRELDRSKNLFENKVAAQADYDMALTNYETTKSLLVAAKAQLYRAEINLRYAKIRAPISGIVIARNCNEGQTVIASFNTPTLFTIVNNLNKMQVQANVGEADIGEVKEGQNVNFTVDAYPDNVFTGIVTQVRLQPVMVQNVVNYVAIISAPNPDMKLIPGLTANVNILVHEKKNVLKVPSNALSFVPPTEYLEDTASHLPDSVKQKWEKKEAIGSQKIIETGVDANIVYVWKKNGKNVYPVQLTKGLSDGIYTEVLGNIKEGDAVVVGINNSKTSNNSAQPASGTQNPFMPKFPTRK